MPCLHFLLLFGTGSKSIQGEKREMEYRNFVFHIGLDNDESALLTKVGTSNTKVSVIGLEQSVITYKHYLDRGTAWFTVRIY